MLNGTGAITAQLDTRFVTVEPTKRDRVGSCPSWAIAVGEELSVWGWAWAPANKQFRKHWLAPQVEFCKDWKILDLNKSTRHALFGLSSSTEMEQSPRECGRNGRWRPQSVSTDSKSPGCARTGVLHWESVLSHSCVDALSQLAGCLIKEVISRAASVVTTRKTGGVSSITLAFKASAASLSLSGPMYLFLVFMLIGKNVLRWKRHQLYVHGGTFKGIFSEGRRNGELIIRNNPCLLLSYVIDVFSAWRNPV